MHKSLAVLAIAVLLGAVGFTVKNQTVRAQSPAATPAQNGDQSAATPGAQKVPDSIGLRFRNVQLDQEHTRTNIMQLQAAYAEQNKQSMSDAHEIEMLKKEALENLKLDPKEWDIDVDKLVAVKRPPAPAPAEKKPEAAKPVDKK
jgi:glucose dehydrogenase